MFFTKFGTIAASLVCLFGALLVVMGLTVDPSDMEARALYLAGRNPGQTIDRGIVTIGCGIVFGILAEISKFLARIAERKDNAA